MKPIYAKLLVDLSAIDIPESSQVAAVAELWRTNLGFIIKEWSDEMPGITQMLFAKGFEQQSMQRTMNEKMKELTDFGSLMARVQAASTSDLDPRELDIYNRVVAEIAEICTRLIDVHART